MRLKRTTQHICYIPYHRCLFGNICTNYIYFIIHHFVSTSVCKCFILIRTLAQHILITHQINISHLTRPVDAAFGKAGFGKEVVVDILVGE